MKTIISILIFWMGIAAHGDPLAVHGMVVFGDKQTYVSHLPMFHSPHDFQFVAEVKLESFPRSMALYEYEKAKQDGIKLFTIAPHAMDFSKVLSGEITEFSGSLYKGHFEKGGTSLGPIYVEVKAKIIAKKFESDLGENFRIHEYTVFGKKDEYYAVHKIQEKPSFDVITKVSQLSSTYYTRAGQETSYLNDSFLPETISEFAPIHTDKDGNIIENKEFHLPTVGSNLGSGHGYGGYGTTVLNVIYSNIDELAH